MRKIEASQVIGGRWEVIRPLAEGGMGLVFVARHTITQRQAALKVLDGQRCEAEEALARFQREARFAADIGHPGIVDVFDAGHDEQCGCLFIAMELLDGRSLREHLQRPHHDPMTTLRYIRQMLDPLAVAHHKGYVHRDLKPENIFVSVGPDLSESVKILDFGIARHNQVHGLTQTGTALGTPWYMSPDHALSARDVTPGSDLWSIGVMIYEAFASRVPFEGDTAHAVIVKACTEPHQPLSELVDELPEGLVDIVEACLQKEPHARPRDAAALAEALDRVLGASETEVHTPRPMAPLGSRKPSIGLETARLRSELPIGVGIPAFSRSFAFGLAAFGIVATWVGVAILGALSAQDQSAVAGPTTLGLGVLVFGAAAVTAYALWKLQGADERMSVFVAPLPRETAVSMLSMRPVGVSAPVRGPAHAGVTIVQFGDFACRDSRRLRPHLDEILRRHPDQVRLEWRFSPHGDNFNSVLAAEFAAEAYTQLGNDGFWLVHARLFSISGTLKRRKLERMASELKINRIKLERALQRGTHRAHLRIDQDLGTSLGALRTPCLFINGQRVDGYRTLDELTHLVEAELVRLGKLSLAAPARTKSVHTPLLTEPERVATRHILVSYNGARAAPASMTRSQAQAEARASTILQRVRQSDEEFEAMVLRFSDDPAAAKDHGDLGYLGRGEMDPSLVDVAFALRIGETSPVLQSSAGFHILQRYG